MTTASLLTTLLPSTPYILAYCLPLLLVSILLTFAGAFLTLDRTRTFPPYDVIPGTSETSKILPLQGGIGGLALGFAFGLHLSTFLSLLIPAISPSAALSPKSFLAVWILSATPTTLLGGRWKYCALPFAGISGGTLVTLALSVIIHPSLLTRTILAAVITPLFIIMILVPIGRFQYPSLRFAASATGSFGIILPIALLANVPAWSNVWERLWLTDRPEWGSKKEKGLSASLCLIFFAGLVCDWFLKWKFGVCPDQKWDRYLAKYAANLPHRSGTFQPLRSIWDRAFGQHRSAVSNDVLFPTDKGFEINPQEPVLSPDNVMLHKQYSHRTASMTKSGASDFPTSFKLFRKGRSHSHARFQVKGRREAVKFRTLEGAYDSDSDEVPDEELLTPTFVKRNIKQWQNQNPLLNPSAEKHGGKGSDEKARADLASTEVVEKREIPEYSDYDGEEPRQNDGVHGGPDWTPEFLRRHQCSLGNIETDPKGSLSRQTTITSPPLVPDSPVSQPLGAVPATPSLIQALDRIAIAQHTVFGTLDTTLESGLGARPGLPRRKSNEDRDFLVTKNRYKGFQWDEFWKDIRKKART